MEVQNNKNTSMVITIYKKFVSFSCRKNLDIFDHIKYDSTSVKLFCRQMSVPTAHVETKVFHLSSKNFAIVMNGRSVLDTHFLFMYLTFSLHTGLCFPSLNSNVFSPLQNEKLNLPKSRSWIVCVLSTFWENYG